MSESDPDIIDGTDDFSPGFLDTPQPDTLPAGATPDAKNCVFVNPETQDRVRARLRRRKGARLTNPTAIAAGVSIDGLWEFTREGGTGELIAMCNGALSKWDGASTYTALTNGSGFTAGTTARAFKFRNNLHVTDGTLMKRYDGTACYAVGFAAPTGAPALTVGPAGGPTGTYEGFAVWVDVTTEHISSPSAISAAVVFANQQRTWAKPAGAPPANVTHWRIYCRRTDTPEANYFRTGLDQLVATVSYTEATSDATRRDLGPLDQSNDVPPVFAIMEEYNGYRLGIKSNSSDLYISKQFDAESQHPKDVFPVGGRGDTRAVSSIRKYGEQVALRKPTKTYRLLGERVPFQIKGIDNSLGGISQTSGQEIDGLWYDWDEQRGPYVTDLNAVWMPIADQRIKTITDQVNKIYLAKIEAAYYAPLNLMVWAVPTSSSRKRTLLAYHTGFKRWLPPITGHEYTTLASFTTTVGALGLYFGDEWGRIYELFSGESDGPPSGTLTGTITAVSSNSITVNGATFYTTGSALAGMPVAVVSTAGVWQWVRASTNGLDTIILDTVNNPPLANTSTLIGATVYVGAIEAYWISPWLNGKNRSREKRGRLIFVEGAMTSASYQLSVDVRYNRLGTYETSFTLTFPASGLTWGSGLWGTGLWGAGTTSAMRKHRHTRSYFDVQLRVRNYLPNQPFEIGSYALTADWLKKRLVASV